MYFILSSIAPEMRMANQRLFFKNSSLKPSSRAGTMIVSKSSASVFTGRSVSTSSLNGEKRCSLLSPHMYVWASITSVDMVSCAITWKSSSVASSMTMIAAGLLSKMTLSKSSLRLSYFDLSKNEANLCLFAASLLTADKSVFFSLYLSVSVEMPKRRICSPICP